MQEEDYEILRNRADASPTEYTQWDPHRQFRNQYAELHKDDASYEEQTQHPVPVAPAIEEDKEVKGAKGKKREEQEQEEKEEEAEEEALSRHSTASSSSSSSSSSSTSSSSPTHSARLEEVRTAHSTRTQTQTRDRAATVTSQASSGHPLHLHPTERHPEAIRRIETHRSQHAGTVGASQLPSRLSHTLSRRRTEKPLPSLGAGKPFPPPLPDREEYVVEFDGVDDPLHAQNWPMKKKLYIGAILAFDALYVHSTQKTNITPLEHH
jgi:DHA1 family multidrug resistance protein-like MFS transporter